jgi:C4-dicarboxylate-specific signal transduction histidine kinase
VSEHTAELQGERARTRPTFLAALGFRAWVGPLWDSALGAGLAILALLLRKLLPIEPGVGLYPLPLSAVIISAWWLGRAPGLVATAVSAVGIGYWFLPPLEPLGKDLGDTIGFGIFIAVALLAVQFSLARRRAERALRESESRLRRNAAYLAETQRLSHTGSWAWVPATGEIRYLSEECRRLLEVEEDGEPLRFGPAFLERIHRDDLIAARARLEMALEQRSDFELDVRVALPSGTTRDIFGICHPVLDASGAVVEYVGTLIDVTERNRAERERERLRQAQADLERINRVSTMGELAASLAHEIRQPIAAALTNARTCLRWLDREVPELAEARAAAARAAADSTRVAEIIARVRSLFQKDEPPRSAVDVNAAAGEMVWVLRREAERRSVALHTAFAPDLPRALADRVQLQQVLMNLMLNAIDAMKDAPAPRNLTIRTEQQGEVCVVSVIDTGPGVAGQRAGSIFDAFYTTKPDGTGMGLPISRSIVEAHGGKLWLEPGQGRGAAFRFTLPVANEADA